jgi:hypothetical protein
VLSQKNKPVESPASPVVVPPVPPTDSFEPVVPPVVPPVDVDVIELARYNELKNQYDQVVSKQTELEKKVSGFVETDPETYRLSHVKKNNPELFSIYASLRLTGNMKPVDLLVEDYISENPEYKNDKNKVVEFILNKYGLDVEPPKPLNPEDYSEEEVAARELEISKATRQFQINEMRLNTDYKVVQKKFADKFDAIELPFSKPKLPEEILAEKETLKSTWKPVVDEVFKTVSVIPIFSITKEGEKPVPFIEFALTDVMKKEYSDGMIGYLAESGSQPSKESLEGAYSRFHMKFIADNLNEIVSHVIKKARELTETEYDKLYHNPSGLIADAQRGTPVVDLAKEGRDAALRSEGLRI